MYIYKKRVYILLFGIVDVIGNILKVLFIIFRKTEKAEPKKILVIRVDHIGDVVAATSVLAPLCKSFPSAEIDVMVPSWAESLIAANPDINNVIKFDPIWFKRKSYGFSAFLRAWSDMKNLIRNGKYDTVVDLRGDVRHIAAMFFGGARERISYGITGGGFLLTHNVKYDLGVHELDKNITLLRSLGVSSVDPKPKLAISDKDNEEACKIKKDEDIQGNFAVVHMVPGHDTKKWTADGFRESIEFLIERKKMKVVVGGGEDKRFIEEVIKPFAQDVVDLSGKTSLGVLGALLKDALLFVGVDSGPLHIAAAQGVPCVVLFSGVNDPDKWVPRSDKIKVVYPGRGKDLAGVTADEVCRAIDEVLEI